MHIQHKYHNHFSDIIWNNINHLDVHQNLSTNVISRSRTAISRRKKKRNLKLKCIQQTFTLNHEISELIRM
ncbi:unnamed protein product [Rotaria sp. Silwood2]|nr:unnamed protein product [Rotaria sp. Silwood2]CAF2867207.1 unnamed protein product [Rotaria sp. Silwood2]CAF3274992.1 unnamed protein product [Rotaria sp. Silwood2]CAF4368910.1 unnamed protein product [Rotaria sp. Silwood2]CAF4464569.1 unnamed protein product [Rotaria sp. Silwood2]